MKALQCLSLAFALRSKKAKVKNLFSETGQAHPDGEKLAWLLRQLTDTAPAWGFPCLVEQEQRRSAAASHPFLQLPIKMLRENLNSKRTEDTSEFRSCL